MSVGGRIAETEIKPHGFVLGQNRLDASSPARTIVFHAWEPGAALRLPQAICFRRSAAVAPAFNNPCMGDRNKAQTKDRNRPDPHSKSNSLKSRNFS